VGTKLTLYDSAWRPLGEFRAAGHYNAAAVATAAAHMLEIAAGIPVVTIEHEEAGNGVGDAG